jgi:hypothetical protein
VPPHRLFGILAARGLVPAEPTDERGKSHAIGLNEEEEGSRAERHGLFAR